MSSKRRKSPSSRRIRSIAVLPTLFTLLNVICGFAAIHFTARGMNEPDSLWLERPEMTFFAAAAWIIFLAMVFDGVDGFLARMTGGVSSFGGHLDSLADMISFGVAPAFLMIRVVENSLPDVFSQAGPIFASIPGRLLWLVAALYVCCAALRLARFNVENQPEEASHMGFSGLPSPAAAGVVSAAVLLCSDLPSTLKDNMPTVAQVIPQVFVILLPLITTGIALLMVSRIPYRHLVNQYVRGRRPFSHMVRVVLIALLLFWQPQFTLAIGFFTYAAGSAIHRLWRIYAGRKQTYTPESYSPDMPQKNITDP